ncbi:MAG: hypothetical protein QF635_03850 [Candidatus Thalassarchaeaceae archaeon]|nr:hypothetical protein [Candidatus Thalassarchaeaceae archaeon]
MDPISTSLALSVASVRALLKTYDAYVGRKVMETDMAVCQEVRRRVSAILDESSINHERAHRAKDRTSRREYERLMDICNSFLEDTKWSVTRAQGAGHPALSKLGKKDVRVLVEHDLEVLQSLDSCNSRTSCLIYDTNSDSMTQIISEFSNDFGKVKSQFRERNTIFDGVTRR